MQHRQASRHLSSLLTGELAGDRRAEVEEHVDSCAECREWSETYEFLSDALLADHEADHPSSEQLAHLAVDAKLLTAPERGHLAAHLEECGECRREVELSRSALTAARRDATLLRFTPRLPSRAVALRLGLAASLLLAVALTFIVGLPEGTGRAPEMVAAIPGDARPATEAAPTTTGDTRLDPVGGGAAEPADATAPEPSAGSVPAPAAVNARAPAGSLPAGIEVGAPPAVAAEPAIETPRIVTANEAIESGDVTLRAAQMVVLGEGFSIGSAGSLGVEIVVAAAAGTAAGSQS